MKHLPPAITNAAAAFDRLPGVGPRAALRYAYWLITQPKHVIQQFAEAVTNAGQHIKICDVCGTFTEDSPCDICGDPARDAGLLCIVATNQDLRVIEESAGYKGRYHVLGGVIDPIEGRTAATLNIPRLVQRLETMSPLPREIIFGFDPDVQGDTTAAYLDRELTRFSIPTSRFARGLPHGAQIEYADSTTVADALTHRRPNKKGGSS